jgi:hypothetical protein
MVGYVEVNENKSSSFRFLTHVGSTLQREIEQNEPPVFYDCVVLGNSKCNAEYLTRNWFIGDLI